MITGFYYSWVIMMPLDLYFIMVILTVTLLIMLWLAMKKG